MLNHIYIDNYKCFVNFECKPESLQLALGKNGTGKTAVFDVLETLRDFVCVGVDTRVAFPTSTLTAWDTRKEQTFELGISGNGGQYTYRLVLEHDRTTQRSNVKNESLDFDERRVYEYADNVAHLHTKSKTNLGTLPYDGSQSAIPRVPSLLWFRELLWFRDRLSKLYVFSPDPLRMAPRSETETERPDRALHAIASWLRHLSQESVDTLAQLRDNLRNDVIEGLTNMNLEKVSETTRTLMFEFKFSSDADSKLFRLPFDQLSTGQRNLVALFTILYAGIGKDMTVCIDEPDNYVALGELQPWLTALRDRIEDREGQCLLISHHPELINYLAATHGLLFHREESGPVRAKPFEWKGDEPITPAELVARGWE